MLGRYVLVSRVAANSALKLHVLDAKDLVVVAEIHVREICQKMITLDPFCYNGKVTLYLL